LIHIQIDPGQVGYLVDGEHLFSTPHDEFMVEHTIGGRDIEYVDINFGTSSWRLAFAAPPVGLGLHRVQANVIPTNTGSVRVAEKAGFRMEGLGRNYLKIAGEWRDHVFYGKLSGEHQIKYL